MFGYVWGALAIFYFFSAKMFGYSLEKVYSCRSNKESNVLILLLLILNVAFLLLLANHPVLMLLLGMALKMPLLNIMFFYLIFGRRVHTSPDKNPMFFMKEQMDMSFKQVACLYAPCSSPRSASKKLGVWIRRNKDLVDALVKAGWQPYRKVLTPKQVSIIVSFLGSPVDNILKEEDIL